MPQNTIFIQISCTYPSRLQKTRRTITIFIKLFSKIIVPQNMMSALYTITLVPVTSLYHLNQLE